MDGSEFGPDRFRSIAHAKQVRPISGTNRRPSVGSHICRVPGALFPQGVLAGNENDFRAHGLLKLISGPSLPALAETLPSGVNFLRPLHTGATTTRGPRGRSTPIRGVNDAPRFLHEDYGGTEFRADL
jgi:hypothetical protein